MICFGSLHIPGKYGATSGLRYEHECTSCGSGKFCVAGSSEPIDCRAGSFAPHDNTKGAGPIFCALGDECYEAREACIACWAGYSCPTGASQPIPCGVGNYSMAGVSVCSICEPGHYCGSNTTDVDDMYMLGGDWDDSSDLAGRCFNGTYCPAGMARAPDLLRDSCPTGHYCPTATTYPVPCTAGTYMPVTGADSVGDCLLTPRGYYTTQGQSNYSSQLCAPGYYCPLGSTSPTEVPCPERFYLPQHGGGSISDCSLCLAGGYCPNASALPKECPGGYFCTTGSSRPEPCRPGTYSNKTGLRRTEDCLECIPGYFCDGYGLTSPRGPCDPGYYCLAKSYTSAPHAPGSTLAQLSDTSSIGGLCPSGGAFDEHTALRHCFVGYCPQGSNAPRDCLNTAQLETVAGTLHQRFSASGPPGKYNNYTGATSASDCKDCDPGKIQCFCVHWYSGMIGFYCSGSSNPRPSGECRASYFACHVLFVFLVVCLTTTSQFTIA